MAILEDSGWKYTCKLAKSYAPNAAGQTINEDPTPTVIQFDSTPLYNSIPGLTVASNRVNLPNNLEYYIRAWTILTSNSTNGFIFIPILYNFTDGNAFDSGSNGPSGGAVDAYAPIESLFKLTGGAKELEFQILKKGNAAATGDVTVARNYIGAYNFSNSTAGFDNRSHMLILAR